MLTQLADPAWALDTRLVQSYAYNDVIRAAAASDESIGGFLEAMRTKQTKGTYLSLADSTLWPALMSGTSMPMHSCCLRVFPCAMLGCACIALSCAHDYPVNDP